MPRCAEEIGAGIQALRKRQSANSNRHAAIQHQPT